MIALALLCALSAAPPPAFASRTFDAADLRREGLVRFADLLRLAEGWDVGSIEGFTVRAAPPGFPLPERFAYALVVDGVPIPVDQLGTTHLNRLPFTLEDVEHALRDRTNV